MISYELRINFASEALQQQHPPKKMPAGSNQPLNMHCHCHDKGRLHRLLSSVENLMRKMKIKGMSLKRVEQLTVRIRKLSFNQTKHKIMCQILSAASELCVQEAEQVRGHSEKVIMLLLIWVPQANVK